MATLSQIKDSIVKGDNAVGGDTLIIHNHLAQMRLFGIRQGVEIYPDQDDDYDTRKNFIANIWKQNQLDLYLDRIWDNFLVSGEILLYLRPTKEGSYKIYYYPKGNFKAYYNENGDLNEVIIIYSYKIRNKQDYALQLKWIKLSITIDSVIKSISDQRPSYENNEFATNVENYSNSLGFIPCIVCKNMPNSPGEDGVGEFDRLASQIEAHDKMMFSMNSNLEFFGSPSLVSTRSPNELLEAIETDTSNLTRNRTTSSAGGWYGSNSVSTQKQDPFVYRNSGGIRIKRVVGNVQPEERFGYIAPDPISPDHAQHVREVREAIHFALGGIDERGISANATAYEMKSIYGRCSATAMKKCRALYDHGLCKLLEMALAAEEDLFRKSLAAALKKDILVITNNFIMSLMEKGKIPNGVFGLPPLGIRLVRWRWTGPVFEDSPQDKQMTSIMVRNLQELGVRSLEALRALYPNKTDKELELMLSGGYPFRYMSSVAATTNQILNLYQSMLQTPDQQNPNIPLAATIPITPLISKSIQTLFEELNYDPDFQPIQPGDLPKYNVGGANYDTYLQPITTGTGITNASTGYGYAGYGLPNTGTIGNATPSIPTNIPTTGNQLSHTTADYYPSPLTNSGVFPSTSPSTTSTGNQSRSQYQQSLEGSIQQRSRIPEFAAPIPESNSTISPQPTQPIQQPVFSSSVPTGLSIPPDLAVTATQPGSIWQQLFPNFLTAIQPRSKRTRKK